MTAGRAGRARLAALLAWSALLASIACWPAAGVHPALAIIAGLPLLLPVPGLLRGVPRALRFAPLAEAPALAVAITEVLANPAARVAASITLALVLAAFAGIIAALRTGARG
ncbi:MAG TPA: DUF2069 domain-containing protein [Steroidobacteraceae bacterium]|jgi:uncharacterized membrane protein